MVKSREGSKLEIADRLVGDVLVLTLSGQMLLDDGDLAFGRRIDDFVSRGIVKFVVDLGAVTYIDSSGVGMMAGELKQVRRRGGDIRLLHLNSRAQRLFGTMKRSLPSRRSTTSGGVRSFVARPVLTSPRATRFRNGQDAMNSATVQDPFDMHIRSSAATVAGLGLRPGMVLCMSRTAAAAAVGRLAVSVTTL